MGTTFLSVAVKLKYEKRKIRMMSTVQVKLKVSISTHENASHILAFVLKSLGRHPNSNEHIIHPDIASQIVYPTKRNQELLGEITDSRAENRQCKTMNIL